MPATKSTATKIFVQVDTGSDSEMVKEMNQFLCGYVSSRARGVGTSADSSGGGIEGGVPHSPRQPEILDNAMPRVSWKWRDTVLSPKVGESILEKGVHLFGSRRHLWYRPTQFLVHVGSPGFERFLRRFLGEMIAFVGTAKSGGDVNPLP